MGLSENLLSVSTEGATEHLISTQGGHVLNWSTVSISTRKADTSAATLGAP